LAFLKLFGNKLSQFFRRKQLQRVIDGALEERTLSIIENTQEDTAAASNKEVRRLLLLNLDSSNSPLNSSTLANPLW
jgi:hypothetical protein